MRRAKEKLQAVGAAPTDIRLPPEIITNWLTDDPDYDPDRREIEGLPVSEVSKQFLPEVLYVYGRSPKSDGEHFCCTVRPDDDLVEMPVPVARGN